MAFICLKCGKLRPDPLIFLLCLMLTPAPFIYGFNVQGIYNGEVTQPVRTLEKKDTFYFSLKDIARLCSAKISWYPITGKTVFSINNHKIGLFYGTKRINIDEKKITFDKEVIIESNVIYVPLEFLQSQHFKNVSNMEVSFNPDAKILTLESEFNVGQPRVYENKDSVKMVFELLERLDYKLEKKGGKILFIKFYKGKIEENKFNFDTDLIKEIQLENQHNTAICKFVMSKNDLKIYNKYINNNLILYIYIHQKDESEILKEITTTQIETAQITDSTQYIEVVSKTTPSVTATGNLIKKNFCIVIDPGHGGEDPGAIGSRGIREKDLNLSISKEITRLLKEAGYEIFITRDTDVFIPLVDRTDFANKKGADIFVSIHCNANIKKDTQGFEIYFLSEKASDADASATEILENSSIKLEIKTDNRRKELQQLLWSMVINEFMNESSKLCSYITKNVVKRANIENRGIKQAGFYVLRGAQMPAVLVECGFISNSVEETKLTRKKFQNQISDAIFGGIKEYANK